MDSTISTAAARVIDALKNTLDVSEGDLFTKRGSEQLQMARSIGVYVLRKKTQSSLQQIGLQFKLSHTAVRDMVGFVQDRLDAEASGRGEDLDGGFNERGRERGSERGSERGEGESPKFRYVENVNRVSELAFGSPLIATKAGGRKITLRPPPPNRCRVRMKKIERNFGGFGGNSITVLAAPVRTGKTTFTVQMLRRMTCEAEPVPTLFFSLRSRWDTIQAMLLAEMADVRTVHALEPNAAISAEDSRKIADFIETTPNDPPLWVEDSSQERLSLEELDSQCVSHVKENGVRLVVIDDLEHFSRANALESATENEWIRILLARLRKIARKLNIAIFALSGVVETGQGDLGSSKPGIANNLAPEFSVDPEILRAVDNVWMLRRHHDDARGRLQKCRLTFAKSIYGLEENIAVDFDYDPNVGRFVNLDEELETVVESSKEGVLEVESPPFAEQAEGLGI